MARSADAAHPGESCPLFPLPVNPPFPPFPRSHPHRPSSFAQLSSDEALLRSEGLLVSKMNLLLVGILKHDWPANWPSFIPDIVAASKCVGRGRF
jgi:hypothetical protein